MPRKNQYLKAVTEEGGKVELNDKPEADELHELETAEAQQKIIAPEDKKFEVTLMQDDGSDRVLILPSVPNLKDVVGKNRIKLALQGVSATVGLERSKLDTSTERLIPALGVIALKRSTQDAIAELISEATKVPKYEIEGRVDATQTIIALTWFFHFNALVNPPIAGNGETQAGK